MEQLEGCYGCRSLARRVTEADATIAALQKEIATRDSTDSILATRIRELEARLTQRTAELEALKIHCAIVEEHKVIAYKDAANLQAELEAVRVDNRTYINERHENMKQIEQLQADLAEHTSELEAVSNFIGVKYDAESKTWVSGQAPYLSAGTTKQEACIAAVDALRLACATWETKYRDLQAELERVSLLSSHNERRFEMLDKKYKEFRTLLLALPKVEVVTGDTVVNIVQQYNFHQWMLRALQHRQGMEG